MASDVAITSSTTITGTTVIAIQGNAISSEAPTDGYALIWDAGISAWRPIPLASSLPPSGSAGGDLSSTYPNPIVAKIQGNSISSILPSDGYVLTWDSAVSEWKANSLPTIPSSLPPNGSAGGDLNGTYPNPTVAKLQGNSVVIQTLGTLEDGYILTWDNTDGYWEAAPPKNSGGLTTDYITSNGTWTAPVGVTQAMLIGCGGGGAGGSTFTFGIAVGGGGGGGALQSTSVVSVVPGNTYSITIGDGGTGSTTSNYSSNFGNGSNTTFDSLASFAGAAGGMSNVTDITEGQWCLSPGQGGKNVGWTIPVHSTFNRFLFFTDIAGGGFGGGQYPANSTYQNIVSSGGVEDGHLNIIGGYNQGTGAASGAGGSGGGGGGAGPQGNGADGGQGFSTPSNGSDALANSGAGGGGAGYNTGGTGMAIGGAGGSGYLYIVY